MRNLLRSNFSRLWRSKLFYLCVALMCANAAHAVINNYYYKRLWAISAITPDGILLIGTQLLPIFIAVFMAFFVGVEHSGETLRNKLVVGHTRTEIYLSYLITCGVAALLMHVLSMGVVLVAGVPLLGGFRHAAILFPQALCSLLSTLGFVALFLMPALVIDHRTVGVIVLLLLALFLSLYLSDALSIALGEPAFNMNIERDAAGEVILVPDYSAPNPKHLSGVLRAAVQFLYDFLPNGQMYQYRCDIQPQHFSRFPLYSLLLQVGGAALGCYVFRRRDLK